MTAAATATVPVTAPQARKPSSRGARKTPAPVEAKVAPVADEQRIAQGWQELLERGLRHKAALLQSSEFKTTTEAGALLGIKEPAVRKRIREGRLFALRMPGGGEYRIPMWALDPAITGRVTAVVLSALPDVDEWQVYHALSTPAGGLHGLRPFECLLTRRHLLSSQRAAREELVAHLQIPDGDALREVVMQVVRADLEASGEA